MPDIQLSVDVRPIYHQLILYIFYFKILALHFSDELPASYIKVEGNAFFLSQITVTVALEKLLSTKYHIFPPLSHFLKRILNNFS